MADNVISSYFAVLSALHIFYFIFTTTLALLLSSSFLQMKKLEQRGASDLPRVTEPVSVLNSGLPDSIMSSPLSIMAPSIQTSGLYSQLLFHNRHLAKVW